MCDPYLAVWADLPPLLTLQTADKVTLEVINNALSACGRTMDDYKDVDKRQSFHAQYGKLAVSVCATQGCIREQEVWGDGGSCSKA